MVKEIKNEAWLWMGHALFYIMKGIIEPIVQERKKVQSYTKSPLEKTNGLLR